jgi:hypothetical protein
MIYNDDFVWLHFPKCAGTKIEMLFKKYLSDVPGLFQDSIDPKNDTARVWHDSVADREARNPAFVLGSRTVICSIRRLPSWLASRYNFEYERSPQLPHNPELLLEGKFLERGGSINHADSYISKFLPRHLLRAGHVRFLRTEHFERDFLYYFGRCLDVSVIPREEYARKGNTSKNHLPAEIVHRLYSSRDVYAKCPEWRFVEELAYGSS